MVRYCLYRLVLVTLSLIVLTLGSPLVASASAVRWQGLAQPYFETIEENNRPLTGPIRAFAQDQDGFIWIVSDYTLWRWDAYELLQIKIPQQTEDLSPAPDIYTVKADPDGTIWLGTSNGLYSIQHNTATPIHVAIDGLSTFPIEFLAFDYSGNKKNIFLSTEYGIYEYSPATNSMRTLQLSSSANNRIHSIHISSDNYLWVASSEGLLYKNLAIAKNLALNFFQGLPVGTRISALFSSNDQRLWIGTAKLGVFIIDKQHRIKNVGVPANKSQVPWIYDITETQPGLMWFGTFGKGIIEYDEKNNFFKTIEQQRTLKSNLLDNDIWTLFRDQRGLIWVGSRLGVNMFNAPQRALLQIPGGDSRIGLSDPLIYSVLAMPDQSLWLGTGKHGIDIIHPYRATVRHLNAGSLVGNARIPEDSIDSLSLINDSVFSSSNWSTLQFNKAGTYAKTLRINGRPVDEYASAFAWFNDQLWVGGVDGLWRIPNNENQKAVNVFASLPGDHRISYLFVDRDCLWVGKWQGLTRVCLDLSIPGGLRIESPDNLILQQQYINTISKDAQNRIWIGTSSAGLFFNTEAGIKQNKAWQNLTENDGLPGNSIGQLQSDKNNNIWIGSSYGIAFIDGKTLAITAILPEQGASAAPYESSTQTAQGEIVFGGGYGLTIIDPKLWSTTQYKPKLVITRIESSAKEILAIQTTRNTLGVLQNLLVVPPNTKRLAFDFSALDFISARVVRYRFRLLGLEESWTETKGMQHTAAFTSLAPGKYELQVQYSFDGQKWQGNGLSLAIDLMPTWYQQDIFKLILALLAIGSVFIWIQWRDQRYKLQQQKLERRVLERTTELENVNHILKRQAAAIEQASLTDPLTGLHNRRFFQQRIDSEAQLAVRRYQSGSNSPIEQADLIFFLIDIDNFKRINDQLGHAAGDEVLIEMRQRLQSVFRGSDFLIRWGGEEFLAVARGASRAKAAELAERVRIAVNGVAIFCNKPEPVAVTCSIGFAPYPFLCGHPQAVGWQETLALADAGLYAAKNGGRNSWVGFKGTDSAELGSVLAVLRTAPETALSSGLVGVIRSTV